MKLFRKKKAVDTTWRESIIVAVQRIADTPSQKIDASIVSRVASLTIDETLKALQEVLKRVRTKQPV